MKDKIKSLRRQTFEHTSTEHAFVFLPWLCGRRHGWAVDKRNLLYDSICTEGKDNSIIN